MVVVLDDEAKKLEIKRKFFLGIIIVSFVAVVVFTLIVFNNLKNNVIMSTNTIFIGMSISAICIISLMMSVRLVSKMRKVVMNKYMTDILHNYSYIPDAGINESIFRSTKFVAQYSRYCTSDYIMGNMEDSNKKFAMCNISVFSKNTIEKAEELRLFKGIFAVLSGGENTNLDIKIYPDFKNKFANQIVGNLKKMVDVKNIVRLENTEFERYFEVYASNQIEARKKITVEFMEKLLEYAKRINKRITIFYINNVVFLFIENLNIIDEKRLFFKGLNESLIEDTKKNIKDIYELMGML